MHYSVTCRICFPPQVVSQFKPVFRTIRELVLPYVYAVIKEEVSFGLVISSIRAHYDLGTPAPSTALSTALTCFVLYLLRITSRVTSKVKVRRLLLFFIPVSSR